SSWGGGPAPSAPSCCCGCASCGSPYLPAGLTDARELATVGHLTDADTGQAELAEVTAGAAVGGVAVADADRRGVARLAVQLVLGVHALLVGGVRGLDDALELGATLGVAGDDLLALLVLGNLGLLG